MMSDFKVFVELEDDWERFEKNKPYKAFIEVEVKCPAFFLNSLCLDLESSPDISTGAKYVLYTLENRGHGPWDAIVNGKKLEELSFDFIVEQQKIIVE
ncbi:MAG: hypothetical protein IPO37_12190 [Saprospiraceae bacterium]|nr:hypothetical protein [Saprospiraceae bacterium]